MVTKRTGLGKGLDSLIPASGMNLTKKPNPVRENNSTDAKETEKKNGFALEKIEASNTEETGITMVKIGKIEPNREQPRTNFDEDALMELADSIRQFGILQPLLVQKRDNYYDLIAGERRWRAAKIAGLTEVPVIIKDFSEQETIEIALIENIQREDLNPIEEAKAYKRLLEEFHLKQDEVAERVSKSRSTVTNSMRLLRLDERVQDMVTDGVITTGHARAILALSDGDEQYRVAGQVFDENLSVRETEQLVKSIKEPKKPKSIKKVSPNRFIYQDMEEKMKSALGTKVTVAEKGRGKGRIEIEYYSDDELERIYHLLMNSR